MAYIALDKSSNQTLQVIMLDHLVWLQRAEYPLISSNLAQKDSDHMQRRAHPTGAVMSQMEAMERFMVMQSPSFNGEPNAEVAKNCLKCIRRISEGLDIQKK